MRISALGIFAAAYLCILVRPAAEEAHVLFVNRLSGIFDAPIVHLDGSGAGTGSALVQLFLVKSGGTLAESSPPVRFRGTNGTLAKYFDGGLQVVPGVILTNHIPVTGAFRVRAWEGTNWETAALRGESPDFPQQLDYLPSSYNLVNMKGFTLLPTRPQISATRTFSAALSFPTAAAGAFAQIEFSRDLVTWTIISTNPVVSGKISFSQPADAMNAFFRARLLSP